VTWALAAGLSDAMDPRAEEPLPALTLHRDGEVRQRDEVLRGLDPADEDSPYHRLLYDVLRHRLNARASAAAEE
jgi:hypothetical protein